MTNAKRGSGSHRWVHLCAAAALGFALSVCGARFGSHAARNAAIANPAPAPISGPAGAIDTLASTAANTPTRTAASDSPVDSNLPTASTGAVTINWTPPTEETNGAPATLSGYMIRYGTASQDYGQTITISNPGIATYVVDDLKPGTYYFTVAAVDSNGNESPLSSEVTATVD